MPSPKQQHALEVLAADPDVAVDTLVAVCGVSTVRGNDAAFVYRLVRSGLVRLELTDDGRAALAAAAGRRADLLG